MGECCVDELADNRAIRINQVVGQQHCKGLVADDGRRGEYRVAQAERRRLADIDARHIRGQDILHQRQQQILALAGEFGFEFRRRIKMVFDRALVPARDEDEIGDACGDGFLNGILDEGFVDHRQHFLGHGLGGWQKTGAQPGDWEHCFANGAHFFDPSGSNSEDVWNDLRLTLS